MNQTPPAPMGKAPDLPALPAELLFEPDGHLTEVALTMVADGETALVSPAALGHLDGCESCGHRLGEAALFSMSAGEALLESPLVATALAPHPEAASLMPAPVAAVSSVRVRARARQPLPVAALVAALLLVVVTAGPTLLDALRGAPGALVEAVTAAPYFFRMLYAFVRGPWEHAPAALVIRVGSALVLGVVGLQVARRTSRRSSWQQGGV